MQRTMQKIYLEITAFICGASIMAFEIIASRMLGPYVGTSALVWSSIIGVILLSLAIGYFWGGRFADRKPRADILSLLISIAAIIIFLTTLFKTVILGFLSSIIPDVRILSLVSSIVLFAAPSVLLGTVSPFAVRIKIKSVAQSGSIVGNLYSISTAGSICGVFLAGFYLIPTFRITDILCLLSIVLLAVSIFLNGISRYLNYKHNS
jgi:MFS family permease